MKVMKPLAFIFEQPSYGSKLPFSDIDDHSICYKLYGSSNEEIEVLAASETSDCPCQTVVTDGHTKP